MIVDDGSEPDVARELDAISADTGAELVRLPQQSGKGSAVRAGIDHLAGRTDAVLVIDADGQHPADAIPGFIAAARDAELVIGDRFGDLAAMPRHRRAANRFTRLLFQLVTGRRVRDTQNGMRLLRGPALASFPAGATRRRRAPQVGAPRRPVGRVGAYAGDLRLGVELVPLGARLGSSALGARCAQRTARPIARPIAAPSRLPASTSVA